MTINPHVPAKSCQTLADAQPTHHLWITGYSGHEGIHHLMGMGLAPGTAIEVLQAAAGNFVIRIGDTRMGITREIAQNILVADQPSPPLSLPLETSPAMEQVDLFTLRDLNIHQSGQVTGFATSNDPALRAYKKKLLAMGLTPGTPFVVTHVAPLGDPIEIQVRGFKLSLRKEEAAFLIVKAVEK